MSVRFEIAASKFSNLCSWTYPVKTFMKVGVNTWSVSEPGVENVPPFLPSGFVPRSDFIGSVARPARGVSRPFFRMKVQRERDVAASSYFRRCPSFMDNAAKRERNWSSQLEHDDGSLCQWSTSAPRTKGSLEAWLINLDGRGVTSCPPTKILFANSAQLPQRDLFSEISTPSSRRISK